MEQVDGVLLGHVACTKHGSSDSLALYEKEVDGEKIVDGHCWSECGFISTKELQELEIIDEDCNVIVDFAMKSYSKPFVMNEEARKKVEDIKDLPSVGWKERGIPTIVSKFYDVRTKKDEQGNVTHRYYPSTEDGEIVGWHVRDDLVKQAKNRGEKIDKPPFFPIGKVRSDCELFGQCKFNKGGKFLVLASGEEDAQAIFTALNVERKDGKSVLKKFVTPVVSTTVGEAAIKQIKNNHEFITSFENVVVMYDNDSAGREGAEKVAKVLKVGQCKIATYHRKDACEHLKRGEIQQIVNAFWKAEKYSPAGVVGSSSTLSALKERASFEKIPLPDFAEDMSVMFNGGIALGEITTIAAASSVGKTTVTNEFLYHFINNCKYRVGVISLESDVGELTENLMSIHTNLKLANMPDEEKLKLYSTPDFEEKHRELTLTDDGEDRYIILDHQGAVTDGALMDKIEYLVKGLDCKIIILDPLTLALSGSQNDGMDLFMSDLLRFVKRERVAHVNVVHVRKNSSGTKANSTGGVIHEEDIKGSGSIFQVSMNNILLMRDKENPDPVVRNTTKVVISKNRRCGNTGPAGFWYYDNYTSRLRKGTDGSSDAAFEDQFKEFDELGAFNNVQLPESSGDDWEVED